MPLCGDLKPVTPLTKKIFLYFPTPLQRHYGVSCSILSCWVREKRIYVEAWGIEKHREAVVQCIALRSLGASKDWKQYSWLVTIVYMCEKKDCFFFFIVLSWLFSLNKLPSEDFSANKRAHMYVCMLFVHSLLTKRDIPWRMHRSAVTLPLHSLNAIAFKLDPQSKCFSFRTDCLLCVSLCRMWSVSFGNQSFVLAKLPWDATRSLERHMKVVVLWTTLYLLLCLFVKKLRPFEGPYFGTWQPCFCEVLLSRKHCV